MAAGLVFTGVGITTLHAQDKPATPAPAAPGAAAKDVTGTWTWQVEGRDGTKRDMTLKLKQEGEKLTGSMPGRQNTEVAITDGTVKDGNIAFTVKRTFGENEIVTKYSGKVEGEVLKLKAETERNGQTRTQEIEAKRAPAEKPAQ